MGEKGKKYYTTGELARLFGIPKQTMMYYDKMGLLKPEFVAKNGYRYYATQQYLTLEIILFLRKIDISIPNIKYYLQNKSQDKIVRLISKKEKEYHLQMQKINFMLKSLESYKKSLVKNRVLPLNQCLLGSCKEDRMYRTPIPANKRDGLSAITVRAHHVRETYSHCFFKEKPTGWGISQKDFFSKHFNHSNAIITESGSPDSCLPCNYIRPAGLYLSLYIKGTYFSHAMKVFTLISDFMDRNHLIPDGDLFVIPIVSYWVTDDPGEYINLLSIKVKAASKSK